MKPFLRSIFIALLLGLNLQAQSLTGVKIDDLSDAQIQAILDRGTSQGMSQDQGEQWALSMGLSPEEAVKFKARAEALNATNAASAMIVANCVGALSVVRAVRWVRSLP